MNVSVIVPALNEAPVIGQCISRAWQAGADEVIVADGGSTDQTAEIARQHDCLVVNCPRGRAVQQNAGARRAGGDVVLFLHADNWLAEPAIEQVRRALRDARVVCGAFRQRIDASGVCYRLLERGNGTRVKCLGLAFGDQAIFVRRADFEDLGGFPEVALMEDLLLMKQLRQRGWPVLLAGPVHVHPRRWERYGVLRQTLRNWALLAAHRCGVAPDRLADYYARHDDRV